MSVLCGSSNTAVVLPRVPSGRIAARGVNLDGDDQADRKAHGGPDKAAYAYAVEDARWWEQEIGRSFAYGEFGENLTTEGVEVNHALVGECWEIRSTVLEVSEPRIPCWRLAVRMNDPIFPRRFAEAMRPGAYLRKRPLRGCGRTGMLLARALD
jgi:MOSC domain-containing protein YiiM